MYSFGKYEINFRIQIGACTMTTKIKRAALYVRVSTDHQTVEN
jgi:hypothetical protein